jgi:poly(ADP-ribose) glycohydrolase ARH3
MVNRTRRPQLSSLRRSRFRGALLGAAIGDGLGASFEGSFTVEEDRLRQITDSGVPLRYTDDTHMTMGLAQALLDRNGFDGAHVAAVFAENYEREPWRGYGPGPPQVFRALKKGVAWDQAAKLLHGGAGSFGNGAAMRVAPVALFGGSNLETVANLARRSAQITHAHHLGVEGAVLQACAVASLLYETSGVTLNRPTFLGELMNYLRSDQLCAILIRLEGLPRGLLPRDGADQLGNGIEAHRSVPLALYAFLEHARSFSDCVLYAIRAGGDTDTIASMAGALSGAYLGEAAIPASWKQRMEAADHLVRLADSLFELAGAVPNRRRASRQQ